MHRQLFLHRHITKHTPAAAWYCVRASANWPAASSFLPFSRYDSTDMELAEQ